MAGRVPAVRARRTQFWALLGLVAGLLLAAIPAAGASTPTAGTAALSAHAPVTPSSVGHAVAAHSPVTGSGAASHPATPRPASVTNATIGPTYASTLISDTSQIPCFWYNYSFEDLDYCYNQTQYPSVVSLANGNIGAAYSVYTSFGTLCNATGGTSLTSWTAENIAWSVSSNNGSTFGSPTYLGSGNCRYPSTSEPTFARGPGGIVWGAFVMSNLTVNQTSPYGTQPKFAPDWTNATGDAIGLVESTNNGTTWSPITILSGITSAVRPSLAVFGSTLYLVYIYTANGSASYYRGQYNYNLFQGLSVQLVDSTNAGVTWSSATTLPGLNASMGYWSSAPSIAVNKTGTLAVSYTSNRTCIYGCTYGPAYGYYADQVFVATSVNNGTVWNGPTLVSSNFTSETPYYGYFNDYYGYGYQTPWMTTPQTSVAWTSSGTGLYVTWAGGYQKSSTYPYSNWYYSGVFAGYSSNSGASWTDSVVEASFSTSNYDQWYTPSVAVSGSTPYIAFNWMNESYCYSPPCGPFNEGYSAWVATSTNGVNWSSTYTGVSSMPYYFYSGRAWQGWASSITIGPSGTPITGNSLPGKYTFSYVGTNGSIPVYAETWYDNVSIGYAYSGVTTYAVFTEHNLSAGANWGVSFDGYPLAATTNQINVTNVPLNQAALLQVLPQTSSYREVESSMMSVPSYYKFTGPTQVEVNFSLDFGVQFFLEPKTAPFVEVDLTYGTQYYYSYVSNGYPYTYPAFPWYFPANVTIEFFSYGEPPITYWNGTGNGSYTGGGVTLNLTLRNPVNETAWAGSYGIYQETFESTGLPSSSSYSFTFNGVNYTTPSTKWTNSSDVGTGGYTVTNITATSSTAGWEYFGSVVGGSNVIVVPAEPVVTLTFAYVNIAAPVGTVTFHALGIGNGTVWSVEFNGTHYSSTTPWLNVSTHPGTYPWAVGSAVAANASVGYAPVGTGSSVSVTTSSTVNISYVSAYRVDVVSGLGGTVSGSGNHWLAHGSAASYTAVASNGYTFGGWTGLGVGSYTGGNATANLTVGGAITETASFYPLPNARFNVTFQQTGIPSGAWWTVYLNGVGYSSNATMLTVNNLLSCAAGLSGQYNVSIPYAYDNATGSIRYAAVTPPSSFCTNGGLVKTLTFAPQYQVTVAATSGGTAYLANGNQLSNESVWAAPSDTVQLTAIPAAGWNFGGWNGTGTGSYTGGQLSTALSAGGPVTEFATFVPPVQQKHPLFWEKFVSSVTFPTGTSWSVSLTSSAGTYTFSAVGSTATAINLPPTQYTATVSGALSADGLTKWAPTTAKFSVPVTQNGTTPVEFGKASYWVSIEGSTGGMVGPMSGWQASGTQLTLNATPSLGMQFVGWTGTGPGNYTGNSSSGGVTVQGPITETASFQPVPKAVTTVTTVWQSPSTWAILGLVGLLVGLIVGIAVRRMRAAPAAAPAAWSGPSDGSSGSGGSP